MNVLAAVTGFQLWPSESESQVQDEENWVYEGIRLSNIMRLCIKHLESQSEEQKKLTGRAATNLLKSGQISHWEIVFFGAICSEAPYNFEAITASQEIIESPSQLTKVQILAIALTLIESGDLFEGLALLEKLLAKAPLDKRDFDNILLKIIIKSRPQIKKINTADLEDIHSSVAIQQSLLRCLTHTHHDSAPYEVKSDKAVKAIKETGKILQQNAEALFFLGQDYRKRDSYTHYDDRNADDKWQLEVYEFAKKVMTKEGYQSVCDFGCGSGFKLINYLGDFQTLGIELEENIEYLRRKYPQREWIVSNTESTNIIRADLLVCSDVIEHLVNPVKFLKYLQKQDIKHIIFSTPERISLCIDNPSLPKEGPPGNLAHTMEWSFKEFRSLIKNFFAVEEHIITNPNQWTQAILCRKYGV